MRIGDIALPSHIERDAEQWVSPFKIHNMCPSCLVTTHLSNVLQVFVDLEGPFTFVFKTQTAGPKSMC